VTARGLNSVPQPGKPTVFPQVHQLPQHYLLAHHLARSRAYLFNKGCCFSGVGDELIGWRVEEDIFVLQHVV
jgi:hypothetical protein